jgi:hypothetical protein
MSILPNATYISPGNPFYGTGGGNGGALSGTSLTISPSNPNTSGIINISNNGGNTVSLTVDGASNNFVISQLVPPAGVQNIMSVSNSTGAATFPNGLFAPNVAQAQTTNLPQLAGTWGASPYPASAATGVVAGQDYTCPRTGMYLADYSSGYNVGTSPTTEETLVGVSDFTNAGLATSSPFSLASAVSFKPWTMASTGADFGVRSLDSFYAVAGTVLTFTRWVDDISGTLKLGDANGGASVVIIPLC